jgi:hypothetical protein
MHIARIALLIVLASTALACTRRPPIVTPPSPPPCDVREVVIYTLDQDGAPLPGVAVHSSEGPDFGRNSNEDGYSTRPACSAADYTLLLDGWHTTNCGEPGATCLGFSGPIHRVHMARDALPEPPPPQPIAHPNPVAGAIWVDPGKCFGDDTGCRTFTIIHAGDTAARWNAPCGRECWPEILRDIDDWAAANYHIVRMWSYLRAASDSPWSRGGSPPYNGLDALNNPDFVANTVALINAIADRGMRVTLESGGIDKLNTEQERRLMDVLHEVGERAGWWKIAWVAPVNEPASTHATSDNDGDVEPAHLRMLVDRLRAGSNVLWHLGGVSNVEWGTGGRWDQRKYTPREAGWGYTHGYRAGEVHDKIRHRFSWQCPDCENGKTAGAEVRLWVDGEGIGQPTSGKPLQYVSVVGAGHQLDAEALSLVVAMQSLRGIGSHMCGTCVQRYQPFTESVGFREVAWTVAQLPRDVHTFRSLVHGGRSNAVFKAVEQGGALLRVDQAIADNGTTVAVAYASRENRHWRVPVTRAMRVRVCSPKDQRCSDEFSVPAGGSVDLGVIRWGRLLIARPE